MQMAVVYGRATTTLRHPSLAGKRLLVCQPLDIDRKPGGDSLIVLDDLGAGAGDVVLVTNDGLGLREKIGDPTSPARWWTLGIVDE